MLLLKFVVFALAAGMAADFVRRFVSAEPEPAPDPTTPHVEAELERVRNYVAEQIRTDVAAGFLDREDVLASALELAQDELPGHSLEAEIRVWVDAAFDEHAFDSRTWPQVTDCDRLDAAFKALRKKGIVARQNFTCCQTCGHCEIEDEIKDEEKKGGPVRGYAFFHMQDTDSAVEGHGLHLAYGAVTGEEADTIETAKTVVETLEEAGLETEWEGTTSRRIAVKVDWKKRRK